VIVRGGEKVTIPLARQQNIKSNSSSSSCSTSSTSSTTTQQNCRTERSLLAVVHRGRQVGVVEPSIRTAATNCFDSSVSQSCRSSPNDSCKIRLKYLHRLGVIPSQPVAPALNHPKSRPATRLPLVTSVEILKGDHSRLKESTEQSQQHSRINNNRKKVTVSFQSSVTVYSIPHRTEYSQRIQQSLWMPRSEMQETVARNVKEFSHDGWDWQRATEEQDMMRIHNELVHPVHVMRQCNLSRQFLMIMSARRQMA